MSERLWMMSDGRIIPTDMTVGEYSTWAQPITEAEVIGAATQMYAFEHLGASRLPDDWEGALFKRRARAVLEAAREYRA